MVLVAKFYHYISELGLKNNSIDATAHNDNVLDWMSVQRKKYGYSSPSDSESALAWVEHARRKYSKN